MITFGNGAIRFTSTRVCRPSLAELLDLLAGGFETTFPFQLTHPDPYRPRTDGFAFVLPFRKPSFSDR